METWDLAQKRSMHDEVLGLVLQQGRKKEEMMKKITSQEERDKLRKEN